MVKVQVSLQKKKKNSVHGEDCINIRNAHKLFRRFRGKNTSVGRLVEFDNNALKSLMDSELQNQNFY